MSRPTFAPVLFLTFIGVLCCYQSKADPFFIEDEIMMDLELQPSFPIEEDFIATFPIQINHRQQKNLRKTQIAPTKLPIKNDYEDVVLYDGPEGRIFFAQVISLLSQGLGNLANPTTTATSTSTFYFTCTISTTACSGRRRRGILIEEDIKESFKRTKSNTRKSVSKSTSSSGIKRNNQTSSVSRSKQNPTRSTTRFVMGSPNKKKIVSPSSVQKIDKTAMPNTTKIIYADRPYTSTVLKTAALSGIKRNNLTSPVSRSKQTQTLQTRFVMGSPNKKKIVSPSPVQKIDKTTAGKKTIVLPVPDLAGSISDQPAPLTLKDLLAVSSSNPSFRHRLNLLISSAHQNGLLSQQLSVNHDDDDGQLNEENQQLLYEGLGRSVTVTSFVVVSRTTTSTPSCSTASGFNQC